jgi:hypothetical protein
VIEPVECGCGKKVSSTREWNVHWTELLAELSKLHALRWTDDIKREQIAKREGHKAHRLYLVDTNNVTSQLLPDQFQGLHEQENCPVFRGDGCPNCRTEEASAC